MRYTHKQKEVLKLLEYIVGYRFSKEVLAQRMAEIFELPEPIEIEWECYDDGGLSDYNAMFSTYDLDVPEELKGDFDIYYLKCKTPNDIGVEVYITEVGYEFG